MPFINVKITRDGATREQKAPVVREITRTLERVLGKRPDQTHIVIDEVDPDNWVFPECWLQNTGSGMAR